MAETNRVVAHLIDGRLLKGTTIDFNPAQPKFHIALSPSESVEVRNAELKALFFVRDMSGLMARTSRRGFDAPRSPNAQGKKVAVRFKDGEVLCGYTLSYVPGREGFFMFPADSDTNNLRIYVLNAAAAEVKTGPEAEALARAGSAAKPPEPVGT